MRIDIAATPHLVELDGVPCRLWKGKTAAAGIPVKVFVHRLAVAVCRDQAPFERELRETLPPGQKIDLRQVL